MAAIDVRRAAAELELVALHQAMRGGQGLSVPERTVLAAHVLDDECFAVPGEASVAESGGAPDSVVFQDPNSVIYHRPIALTRHLFRWKNMMLAALRRPRQLILILGDQLDSKSAAFDGFDLKLDAVWMAEVAEEATHVWSHQARIALFLAAMRHFRDGLRERGFIVHYRALDDTSSASALSAGRSWTRRSRRNQRTAGAAPAAGLAAFTGAVCDRSSNVASPQIHPVGDHAWD